MDEELEEQILDELSIVVPELFNNESSARRLLEQIGLPPGRQLAWTTPKAFWLGTLEQLRSGAVVDGAKELVRAIAKMYPGNRVIATLNEEIRRDPPEPTRPVPSHRAALAAETYANKPVITNTEMTTNKQSNADPERRRKVFVVHGRNQSARAAMFAFLRSIGLIPIEWSQAIAMTKRASPYIGEVLDVALEAAQAVVVLMTPDEIASLQTQYADGDDDPEMTPGGQARPNVLFEAGLALGRSPDRTVLVELGKVRHFSDIAGRHVVRMSNSIASRQELAQRLQIAGCTVDLMGTDWHTAGEFTVPRSPQPRSDTYRPSDQQQSRNPGPQQHHPSSAPAPVIIPTEKITLVNGGEITLSNVTVNRARYGDEYEIVGEATNQGPHDCGIVGLRATMYGADGRIVDTALTHVVQFAPGDTKTFTMDVGRDLSNLSSIKVQVISTS